MSYEPMITETEKEELKRKGEMEGNRVSKTWQDRFVRILVNGYDWNLWTAKIVYNIAKWTQTEGIGGAMDVSYDPTPAEADKEYKNLSIDSMKEALLGKDWDKIE